jgi:glutaredoxin 3
MYTRRWCGYCFRAKRLLDDLGVRYTEVSVDGDAAAFARMKAESGRQTVPQIWINGLHVGGCDDLFGLHYTGQLEPMLAQIAPIP